MPEKNVAQGSFTEVLIEDGFYVLKIQNDTSEIKRIERDIDSTFIQLHFCLKGRAKFIFNEGRYALDVSEEEFIIVIQYATGSSYESRIGGEFMAGIYSDDHSKISFTIFQGSWLIFLSWVLRIRKKSTMPQEFVSPAIAVVAESGYELQPAPLYKGTLY